MQCPYLLGMLLQLGMCIKYKSQVVRVRQNQIKEVYYNAYGMVVLVLLSSLYLRDDLSLSHLWKILHFNLEIQNKSFQEKQTLHIYDFYDVRTITFYLDIAKWCASKFQMLAIEPNAINDCQFQFEQLKFGFRPFLCHGQTLS